MKQQALELDLGVRRTRKQVFLAEMDAVVPWPEMVALIEACVPTKTNGRPRFAHEAVLRIHLLQQWYSLSEVAMEEALLDTPLFRDFAGLGGMHAQPDRVTILRFRRVLEDHKLAERFFEIVNAELLARGCMMREGTAVDATIIHAPSSTKNRDGKRDPDMHSTKKGNQWYFRLKAHIGTDAGSGLVHTLVTTPANAADVTQAAGLLHGDGHEVYGDSGYRGIQKREEARDLQVGWQIAMTPGRRRVLDRSTESGRLTGELETVKARIRSKVEHAFRVLKCQFGHRKARYRGLAKNTQQLYTLFALGNL
ncbi:IS5/IS1182 family transposase [Burkholderia multivorans]|uniref:IS5 family transposase n=1 Tax=Burkholderia multivorans TaxID=87883 RepID=UPI000D010CFD|nr:IS5 family transposase [Burkholderia multivorans]PRF64455.1 IS5/IS1182 family transposase [Burkholderia multivorans]